MWLKLHLSLLILVVACCGCNGTSASNVNNPIVPATPRVLNNSANSSGLKAIVAASPSPQRQHLNCGKNIAGLKKPVKIPDELCFNRKLPVDETEYLNPQDFRTTNLYKTYDLSYEEVPLEVRQVVELIRSKRYQGKKFHVIVVQDKDTVNSSKIVKLYHYSPYEKEPETLFEDNFEFKVQNGKMKFSRADLKEE